MENEYVAKRSCFYTAFGNGDFTACFFFFLTVVYVQNTCLQLQNFKTKRKYIMILQIGSKLHKNEKNNTAVVIIHTITLDLLINRLFR